MFDLMSVLKLFCITNCSNDILFSERSNTSGPGLLYTKTAIKNITLILWQVLYSITSYARKEFASIETIISSNRLTITRN